MPTDDTRTPCALDAYDQILVDGRIVGRVRPNRTPSGATNGYVVWVDGERLPHSFPGESAIFQTKAQAAKARAVEVARE